MADNTNDKTGSKATVPSNQQEAVTAAPNIIDASTIKDLNTKKQILDDISKVLKNVDSDGKKIFDNYSSAIKKAKEILEEFEASTNEFYNDTAKSAGFVLGQHIDAYNKSLEASIAKNKEFSREAKRAFQDFSKDIQKSTEVIAQQNLVLEDSQKIIEKQREEQELLASQENAYIAFSKNIIELKNEKAQVTEKELKAEESLKKILFDKKYVRDISIEQEQKILSVMDEFKQKAGDLDKLNTDSAYRKIEEINLDENNLKLKEQLFDYYKLIKDQYKDKGDIQAEIERQELLKEIVQEAHNRFEQAQKLIEQEEQRAGEAKRELERAESVKRHAEEAQKLLAAETALAEIQQLKDKHTQKTAGSMDLLVSKLTGATSNSNTFGSALIALTNKTNGAGNALKEGLAKAFLSPEAAIMRFSNFIYDNLIKSTLEFDKTVAQVNKTTGGFGDNFEKVAFKTGGGSLFKASAINDLAVYGIGLKDFGESFGELSKSMANFNNLIPAQQKALASSAAEFKNVGVSASVYADLMNKLTGGLGRTIEGAKKQIEDMQKAALGLGLSIDSYLSKFKDLSSSLAGFGKESATIFKELSAMSQVMKNVSERDLVNLSEKFDTLESAAETASKLNTVLQGTYISFTELNQMQDPGERILRIVRAYEASGQQFDKMSRGYKLALAEAVGAGKDLEKAASMFRDGSLMLQVNMFKSSASEKERQEALQKSADAYKKLEIALDNMKIGFTPIITGITKVAEFISGINNNLGGFAGFITRLGIVAVPFLIAQFKLFTFTAGLAFKSIARTATSEIGSISTSITVATNNATALVANLERAEVLAVSTANATAAAATAAGATAASTTAASTTAAATGNLAAGAALGGGNTAAKAGLLSRLGSFAVTPAGLVIGAALAIGGGAYLAYKNTPEYSRVEGEVNRKTRESANTPTQLEGGISDQPGDILGIKKIPESSQENKSTVSNNMMPSLVAKKDGKEKEYIIKPDDNVFVSNSQLLHNAVKNYFTNNKNLNNDLFSPSSISNNKLSNTLAGMTYSSSAIGGNNEFNINKLISPIDTRRSSYQYSSNVIENTSNYASDMVYSPKTNLNRFSSTVQPRYTYDIDNNAKYNNQETIAPKTDIYKQLEKVVENQKSELRETIMLLSDPKRKEEDYKKMAETFRKELQKNGQFTTTVKDPIKVAVKVNTDGITEHVASELNSLA